MVSLREDILLVAREQLRAERRCGHLLKEIKVIPPPADEFS